MTKQECSANPMAAYPLDLQGIQEDGCGPRLFYEVFPERGGEPEGESPCSFEIALHAEMEEYYPPDDPRNRAVLEVLMELAGKLIHRAQLRSSDSFNLSGSYHTLHPPDEVESTLPRLCRTLSLVFANGNPLEHSEEPVLLEQIKAQLRLLNVTRMPMDPVKSEIFR